MYEKCDEDHKNIASLGAYTAAAAGAGAILGSYTSTQIPKRVELADGIEIDVAAQVGKSGVDISYGATTIEIPNIPISTPTPFKTGLHVDIARLDIPLDGSANLDQYVNIVSQYDSGIAQPVSEALVKHTATSAALGALVIGVATFSSIKHFRKHRQYAEAYNAQIDEAQQVKNKKISPKAVIAAGALAAVGLVSLKSSVEQNNNPTVQPTPLHLEAYVSTSNKSGEDRLKAEELKKTLSGITVSGTGGKLINTAAHGVSEYIKSADTFWNNASDNLAPEFSTFYKAHSLHKLYADPSIVPILHISDFHCNYPAEKYIKTIAELTQPLVVANTGDTFTNSNTMPYEKNCRNTLTRALRTGAPLATIIESGGNHDPNNDSDDAVKILHKDSGFTTEAHGVRFVGTDDPEVTTWNPPSNDKNIRQSNDDKRNQQIKEFGHELAETACKDIAPPTIALTHRAQTSYETLLRGCASVALSGHTHNQTPLQKLTTNSGSTAQQLTGGSVTGAEVGITIYQKPNKTASFSLLFFDKTFHSIRKVVFGKLTTDGSIHFSEQNKAQQISSTELEKMQSTLQSRRQDTDLYGTKPPIDQE